MYTRKEYAIMVDKANKENKNVIIINNQLILENKEESLEQMKFNKMMEINQIYEEKASLVKIDTPESEVLTWNIQKSEVEMWQKNSNCLTPFIDILAISRNVDRDILIQKIIEKTNIFNQYMASLTGIRQRLEDLVKTATTKEQLEDIKWE